MGRFRLLKLLAAGALSALLAVTGAAAFSDTQGHWAEEAINKWSQEYQILSGYSDGTFRPDNSITRGAFAGIMNRFMHFQEKADPSVFSDLSGNYWEDEILRLNAAKVYLGNSGLALAMDNITRQQAAAMIARAFQLETEGETITLPYSDAASISTYAQGPISVLNQRGYLDKAAGETFRPTEPITRAEIVQIFSNIVTELIQTDQEWNRDVDGNLMINSQAGASVRNVTITGKLLLAPGASGTVTLEDVDVQGGVRNYGKVQPVILVTPAFIEAHTPQPETPPEDQTPDVQNPDDTNSSGESGSETQEPSNPDNPDNPADPNGETQNTEPGSNDPEIPVPPEEQDPELYDPNERQGGQNQTDNDNKIIEPEDEPYLPGAKEPTHEDDPVTQSPTVPETPPETAGDNNAEVTPVEPETPSQPVNPTPSASLKPSDYYTPARFTWRTIGNIQVPIYAGVKTRDVYSGEFEWDYSYLRYKGSRYNAVFGVDVSAHNNRDRLSSLKTTEINWARAQADDVDFAIVRVAGRYTRSGELYEDDYYAQNIRGALRQGIETGVYIFSQAITIEEALEEADLVLRLIKGFDINGPVCYDWEINSNADRANRASKETATACALAFCRRVEAAGYTPLVYQARSVGYNKYDQVAISKYLTWYPQYSYPPKDGTKTTSAYPNFYYQMDIWQFSDQCTVSGIGVKSVDGNLWFRAKK